MRTIHIETAFLLLAIILLSTSCGTKFEIEETADAICECAGKDGEASTTKLEQCFQSIFSGRTVLISDESLLDSLYTKVVKHLGRTCKVVAETNSGIHPNASFRGVDSDRESMLSPKDCLTFSDNKDYFYIESWGDTTRVKITPETYTESFPDGSSSKLTFSWKEGCAFETEFIESNHYIKKNASSKGEIYSYKLIDIDSVNRKYITYAYSGEFIIEITLNY